MLARLADVDAAPSNESLSDRLGQWLSWSHALALSTALDGKPPEAAEGPVSGQAGEDECTWARDALVAAIAGARTSATGYPAFRQRYLTLQRSMQATTGRLRGTLRDMLAQQSDDMARLAEVDAVMELALSPREQKLLGMVPALLGRHFERLSDAGQAGTADTPSPWLDVFQKDMQSVLLAELDVRFQPVEALLAALRAR